MTIHQPSNHQEKHHDQYTCLLQQLLPMLNHERYKILPAAVLLALKLEGLIGHNMSEKDLSLVKTLGKSILDSKEKKEQLGIMSDLMLR